MAEPGPVTIFGDSHVLALGRVARRTKRADIVVKGVTGRLLRAPFAFERAGRVHVELPAFQRFEAISIAFDPDRLYVFSGPLHTGPLARHRAWRTHCPLSLWPDHPDRLPVTEDEIHAACDRGLTHMTAFLEMAARAKLRLAVMESPRLLGRVRRAWGADAGIVAAADRIARRHVRRRLDALGVAIVETPPQTHRGAWTRSAYAAADRSDPHHGNDAYGAAMITQVDAWAAAERRRTGGLKALFGR